MKYLVGTNFHFGDIFIEQRGVRASRTFCGTFCGNLIAYLPCVIVVLALLVLPAAADTPEDLLAGGHVDQAMRVLEQNIHSAPTAEDYNLLCRADFELDDWDAGIPACEKAVSLAPENGLYHLWLGRIYGEKADHSGFLKAAGLAKRVRSEFERAVEFAPNSWEAHTDLAEFYLEAPGIVGGGEDKALAQADLLMAMNPAMGDWVRARIAQKKKDNAVAEKEYRAAIDDSRGGARAWVSLAGFYTRTGRLDEMEQALHTMESRPLDRPAALMDAASILLRSSRDYPLAIRLVRRYLASGPVEEWPAFKAHCLLGELLEKQGERAAAAEQYRAALAMAHTFAPAQKGLQHVAR
ncbi:MAG TPA: tetratricopeptide repeat protein [Candidatus Deferrimicrobiaceae bacterium]|jgi:tetratricopeptide (TPR) repeat protein|nr:tetratricopeptide repeat protein [Candidatus Deferrimicrobiaceae bacterium]